MAQVHIAAVVVHHGAHQHQLQVGRRQVGTAAEEGPGLGIGRGEQARAVPEPLPEGLEHARHTAQRQAEGVAAGRRPVAVHHVQVILQVLAHAGQVLHHVHAHRLQMLGRADARQQQQVRRMEGAAGQQHLGLGADVEVAAIAPHPHAHGAAIVHQNLARLGVREHRQVRAVQVRGQVGLGCAAALSIDVGDLVLEAAVLLCAVVVRAARHALVFAGLQKGLVQLAWRTQVHHVQRPALAVKVVADVFVVLPADEMRQHVAVAPAHIAQAGPVVVVRRIAAHIQHGVDRAGATEGPPARLVAAAAVHLRVALAFQAVVQLARLGHDRHHPRRHLDQRLVVRPASLHQAHAGGRVLAQAGRQHAAGRASTDDDVVESVFKVGHDVSRGSGAAGGLRHGGTLADTAVMAPCQSLVLEHWRCAC